MVKPGLRKPAAFGSSKGNEVKRLCVLVDQINRDIVMVGATTVPGDGRYRFGGGGCGDLFSASG